MNVNKNAVYVRDAISIPGVHAQFSFSLAAINKNRCEPLPDTADCLDFQIIQDLISSPTNTPFSERGRVSGELECWFVVLDNILYVVSIGQSGHIHAEMEQFLRPR
jgi:hypothetical protein